MHFCFTLFLLNHNSNWEKVPPKIYFAIFRAKINAKKCEAEMRKNAKFSRFFARKPDFRRVCFSTLHQRKINKLSLYDQYCVVKAQLLTEPSSPLSKQTAETSLLKKQENTTRHESKIVKTKQPCRQHK